MKNKNDSIIRIGVDNFVNTTEVSKFDGFDYLFDGFYELVYLPHYRPINYVNESWTGALADLMNDNRMDWIESNARFKFV